MDILYKTSTLYTPLSRESDLSLLEAAKQMDRDALVKIFDLYSPALYNYAYRLSNDSLMADNIVGDVFAKLLEHFSTGRGPNSNLRSYLYEMVYHLVVDEARYSYRSTATEEVESLHQDAYPTNISVEERILFEIVLRAIRDDLTIDQRHVIVLRFLEGFSLQETAAIVGKAVSNIKVIQNRAITALRKALDREGVT
jgi:RNA polymerase sigma-70 factor (ECF subfamily)